LKFQKGIEQFNRGEFYETHETWEELWLAAAEPEKTFLQGIIQIAAAFHHYRRGNLRGTRSLLEAGLKKLERFDEEHRGIRLERLRSAVREWLGELAAGRDPGAARLPRIERVATPRQ
jgi:predicted metal-dependent hydrolase